MPAELTARQAAVLEFVRGYLDANGIAPSVREIATHLGLNSTNGVDEHLRALERKGAIRRRVAKGQARSLVVVGESPAELKAEIARLRAILAGGTGKGAG